jgi:PIN domain nuclease of toxin-antitoxin system
MPFGCEHLLSYHVDPFDGLLIAHAQAEKLTLFTYDPQFERCDVRLVRCN